MSIDYSRARRLLARRDPVLGDLIKRHGPCGLADRQHSDPFIALTHAIISQQLSTKAAATIARRFDALFEGRPTAAAVASATELDLRSVGLSTQKIRYMRDLAEKIENGVLRLDLLDEMSDQDVIEALTLVKGIGRWTAEMFLMFRLHRPDVLPTDDLGIVNAVKRAYQLRSRPTAKRLLRLGESWRPYRSVACWYLWASLGNAPLKE
jgi:DNA-3-methyladenine glycosylase II